MRDALIKPLPRPAAPERPDARPRPAERADPAEPASFADALARAPTKEAERPRETAPARDRTADKAAAPEGADAALPPSEEKADKAPADASSLLAAQALLDGAVTGEAVAAPGDGPALPPEAVGTPPELQVQVPPEPQPQLPPDLAVAIAVPGEVATTGAGAAPSEVEAALTGEGVEPETSGEEGRDEAAPPAPPVPVAASPLPVAEPSVAAVASQGSQTPAGTPPAGAPVAPLSPDGAMPKGRPDQAGGAKPEELAGLKLEPAAAERTSPAERGFAQALEAKAAEAPAFEAPSLPSGLDALAKPQAPPPPAAVPTPPVPVLQNVPLGAVPIEIGLKSLAGINSFEIRLDPEDLGRIDVRLDIDEGGEVRARLTVDRVETLALLQRDARTLERAFEQAGLKASDGAIDLQLRDHGAGGRGDGRQDSQGRPDQQQGRHPGAGPERPPTSPPPQARPIWRGSAGIDVRI